MFLYLLVTLRCKTTGITSNNNSICRASAVPWVGRPCWFRRGRGRRSVRRQTVSQENRSPSGSLGESERGKLCSKRENSEGVVRNELGNGAVGMLKLLELWLWPTVGFVCPFLCRGTDTAVGFGKPSGRKVPCYLVSFVWRSRAANVSASCAVSRRS